MIDAVVLAGGQGQRMGGADKGLLTLHGITLAQRVLDALQPQVGECFISANRHFDVYGRFGATVVADLWSDHRGPLSGICAAAQRTSRPWLLAAPCDTLGVPADLAQQLWQAAQAAGVRAAYARVDGDAVYPLCLLHRDLFADLRKTLERGEYAVGRWLASQHAAAVTIDNWNGPLLNLNTPERLAAAHTTDLWKPSSPI